MNEQKKSNNSLIVTDDEDRVTRGDFSILM